MPITIVNQSFDDNLLPLGDSLSYYKCNAGDRMSIALTIESSIAVVGNNTNPLNINLVYNQIEWLGGSWLDEGFRPGDQVEITRYDNSGLLNIIVQWTATVNYVDDDILDVSTIQTAGYFSGEYFVVRVINRVRDEVEVLFNHVQNGQTGSEFSLIDGESTKWICTGLDALAVSSSSVGYPVGNQSGQFVISCSIQRLADTGGYVPGRKYRLVIDFVQSGIYQDDEFLTGNCLKTYVKMLWRSIAGDPHGPTEVVFNNDANTGWFNEAHNTSVVDSTLIQGVQSQIEYCNPTTHEVIVDGPLTGLGMGGAYISIDEPYYKNRTYQGQKLALLINTFDIQAIGSSTSSTGADTSGYYQIIINSIITNGTEHTINFTINPVGLTTFFDPRDDDRLFRLWVKCGNINHLVYEDQLICPPPVGGPLDLIDRQAFLDHSQNVNYLNGDRTDNVANTEDDLAFFGNFLLTENQEVDYVSATIFAENVVSGASFNLQTTTFSFDSIPVSGAGRYLINESALIVNTLPSNSEKRIALLRLDNSIDSGSDYGVSLYYPFLLRWEYWLDQLNANVDFYPDYNKNWEQYDNLPGWTLKMKIEVVKDGLAYQHFETIVDWEYDHEELLLSSIELYRASDNTNVGIVLEGELMKVVAQHKILSGQWFNTTDIWGMITIEPTESAPRWICSSVLPFDGNTLNPLTPLDNVQMNITFPAPDIAQMECYFNPDKINLINGVKFTSKIKGCPKDPELVKTMTDGTTKTTTTGDDKTLAI